MTERYTKAILVNALFNFQQLRPPRLTRQLKRDLVAIVEKALSRPDGDPLKMQMQTELDEAMRRAASNTRSST